MLNTKKIGVLLACMPVISIGGTSHVFRAHDSEGDGLSINVCEKSRAIINVAVGWTIEKAKERSPALAKPETPGLNYGLATYVNRPAIVNYEGVFALRFECPRMISIHGKNGLVSSVEVILDAADPSSLDNVMDLAASWQARFSRMNFENLSGDKRENVTSYKEARRFFGMFNSPVLSATGKVLGAWRQDGEKISLGVERWNIAPSTFDHPKYIYVCEVIISNYENVNGK